MPKNSFFKQYGNILLSLVITAGAFGIGFYFGVSSIPAENQVSSVINKRVGMTEEVGDFSSFWKVWNAIDEKFVPPSEDAVITNEERIYGALEGLAESLGDPYTVFFPPVENEIFETSIRGNFSGVGMEVGIRDDILTVVAPLKNTPAERAGMEPGDKVLAIDGTPTSGMTIDEAVQLIRGEIGTEVVLTVFREGRDDPFDVGIVRDTIDIPTLDTVMRDDGIFIISLYNFSAPSANLFRDALREFVESGSDKLILDLRGNPGGYLEAANEMASWFLPLGKLVVTEDFGGNRASNEHRSKGYDIFNDNLDFVILVNGGSASASEILAGALREHGVATIVGTTTFGKGSVQELVDITSDTSFKVTVARWLTPNGVSISDGGITPDFEVSYTIEDREEGRDPQLDKAVEILLQ